MALERKVHINAAPDAVWRVLADVERWPEWTPSVKAIRRLDPGDFGPGSRAEIDLRGVRKATWQVTAFEPGRSFIWEAPFGPGLVVEGGHTVEPSAAGSDVTLWIDTRGALGVLLRPLVGAMSRANVEREAAGLKARCESSERPG